MLLQTYVNVSLNVGFSPIHTSTNSRKNLNNFLSAHTKAVTSVCATSLSQETKAMKNDSNVELQNLTTKFIGAELNA